MICGVAIGLAERYGVRVTLVRASFVAAFIAAPIAALVYLLLSLSTPSEISVVGKLQLVPLDETLAPRERFDRFAAILSKRLLERQATPWFSTHIVAIWLLVFAAMLELPRMSGIPFYLAHPIVSTLLNDLSIVGTSLFYLSVAFLFLFQKKQQVPIPVLNAPTMYRFSSNRGAGKMIGGIISGIAQVVELDPVYLRVFFIILNFFTMGLVGAVYLLVWYFYRHNDNAVVIPDTDDVSITQNTLRPSFQMGIGFLFVLLAGIHLANAYRLFFFNESFFQGLTMGLVGMALVWHGIGTNRNRDRMWIIGGASIFFLGIYECVTNIAHLQISPSKNFEIAEIIVALSMVYVGFVALRKYARSMAFGVASVFALSSLLIAVGFIPPVYLMELVRFYNFFYPLIFAGFGLWIAFEK